MNSVVRKMVILSSSRDSGLKGVLKLDKIGAKVVGAISLYGGADDGVLYIRNGAEYLRPVEVQGARGGFEAYGKELAGDIECVLFDGKNVVMRGAIGGNEVGSARILHEYQTGPAEKPPVTEKYTRTAEERQFEEPKPGRQTPQEPPKMPVPPSRDIRRDTPVPHRQPEPRHHAEPLKPARPDFDTIKPPKGEFKYTAEKPFYDAVKLQLEELFDVYPEEELLKRHIPDSDWAHIKYEGEDYYVVGVIREEGKPRYICYGVPADRKLLPESDVTENCEFLSVTPKTPDQGYYMMYQDAITGETLSKGSY